MLQRQNIDIPFSQGLDTKTDPYRVPVGKFLELQNSIFTRNGQLTKRNGFQELSALPNSSSTFLTTFNGDLTAIGSELYAFNPGANTWVDKGNINPSQLSTIPLIRNNYNQTQGDSVIAQNGLVCTAYTQTDGTTTFYDYAVADSVTTQNVVAPTALVPSSGTVSGSPRVFLLGNFFVIVFTVTISAASHLQFIAINIYSLEATAAADLVTAYDAVSTVAWDGFVMNNSLYLAWNVVSGGGISMTYLDSTLAQHNIVNVDASHFGTLVSVTADESAQVVYVSYYDSNTTNGFILAVNQQLDSVLAATAIITSVAVLNLASAAQNGSCTLFYEVNNAYTYDSNVKTNYVSYRTCTQAGSLGTATVLKRSVGLASKAFIVDSHIYVLGAYSSSYQPTYFLLNSTGQVVATLAYQNGGGYLTLGLPSVSVYDSTASILFRFKDLLAAVNKNTNPPAGTQTAGIYSQTGLNMVSISIGAEKTNSVEIANNLHLSGGFLTAYDGYSAVEQSFFLYPDSVEVVGVSTAGSLTAQQYNFQVTYEWTDNQGNAFRSAPSIPFSYTITAAPVSFTGNRTSGSAIIASVSSLTGLQVGQPVSGTGIPANTYILSIDNASQITLSANATSGTATATTITPITLASLKINIPTLRLTYKTANPVKIVIYRWSTGQPSYYQCTSISTPLINSTSTDSVSFTTSSSDATILGNNLIYTTGGVIENIGPPSCTAMTIWDTRVWLIDAENKDTVWFSKPVVQGAPVEFSDLFTKYISPTKGVSGPTGKLKCLFPMDDKIILAKDSALYFINGVGPDITGVNDQYSEPTLITSTLGSNNQNSFVFTPLGIVFQSVGKGIWLLGRDLKTSYIGAEVQAFNQFQVKSALTIPGTNQIRFTLENGVTLMYDYFYQQWGTFYNIPGISSTIYEDLHAYLDENGKVFQENPGSYLDGTNPVLMSFKTAWINLAGLQGYQRAYMFYLMGTFLSPHKISLGIAYDYAPSPSQTVLVQPQNYSGTWGSDATWGSGTPWGGPPALEQWKINLQRQKCQAFQISFSEIFNPIFGTVAGGGLTLSGLNCIVGLKKSYKPQRVSTTAG